ncbi:MAG: FAD binding domain-containing protein [Anaerolineae bacterium]|nr:FAD binding domain-containing protein [Anaerolineae bacterium]
MAPIQAYHRPQTIAEALQLLTRDGVRTALVAGGTSLVPTLGEKEIDEIVDLQALGLDGIEDHGGRLHLGALLPLQTLVDDDRVPVLIREGAFRAGPNTFRHQATLGGTIAGRHWECELLAALLVHDAALTIETTAGAQTLSLADFLGQEDTPAGIIAGITIATGGRTGHARVARTPLDTAIVAAHARRDANGTVRLALTGVGTTPSLIDPGELDALDPPGDFRGSSDYRKEMAAILARRALAQLDE